MENIKKNKLLKLAIIGLTILFTFAILMPNSIAEAANLPLGTANYEGTTYYCRYEIKCIADTVSGNACSSDIKIELDGVGHKRNWFNPFVYNIQFTLTKQGSTDSNIKTVNFTVRADQTDHVIYETADFSIGSYTLSWYGTISSQAVAVVSGSYNFIVF